MSVSLRLRRMGRKKHPVFGLVVADSRSPRDGRFIEDLGRYEPVSEPAVVSLNAERIIHWLNQGAQPSHTVKNLLQKEGILLRRALQLKGQDESAVEEAVAEFKERRAAKAAGAGKKTRAERAAAALQAERAAAKEKAAALAKERAEREAELQRQRDEAEAAARAEAEEARAAAAADAADSAALDDSGAAAAEQAEAQADAEAEGGDAAAEEASPEAVADEAPDAAEEQPAATDDTAEAVADDAGAEVASQTDAAASQADVVEEASAEEAPAAEAPAEEAAAEDTAADASPDKLTDVSGIGPKYSSILTDAGITTFAQLAETSVERLQEIIAEAGSTTAGNEETWPDQARFLAAGDAEGHAAYVESLK